MKDFLGAYGKAGGIGACAGFLLSFLIGLVSGNPFGTVLLRAVLFALLVGGFCVGAQVVLGRFLPELTGASAGAGDPERKGVDIVLPEENPHARFPGVRVTGPGGAAEDGVAEAEALSESARGDGEDEGGGGAPSDLEPPDPESMEAAGSGSPGGDAPAAVSGTAGGPVEGNPPRKAAPLPDLDQPGTGFTASMGGGRAGASRPRRDAPGLSELSGEDPATIARAIRTVLKKDEKG